MLALRAPRSPMHNSRLTSAALLILMLGCRPQASSIVGSRHAVAAGALSIEQPAQVVASVDDKDSTHTIALPGSATMLRSGVIAISDAQDLQVRFFDQRGNLVRSAGTRGSGPGEFQSIAWMGQCATDSLFVWDPLSERISVLDSTGRFARQFRIRRRPAVIRCARDGPIAMLLMPMNLRRPGPDGVSPRFVAPLWLVDHEGDSLTVLDSVPVGESRPLGLVTKVAVSPTELFIGTNDSGAVDVFGLNGQRKGVRLLGLPGRRPTRANYEHAIDGLVAGFAIKSEREAMRRQLLAIPMPDRMPSYGELLADQDGGVWAVESSTGDSVAVISLTDAMGRRIGTLSLPGPLRVVEVGPNYLLGIGETSLGGQDVRLHRFQRRPVAP